MFGKSKDKEPDVVLIGAGIMSATLGMLLKQLDPTLTIEIYERLDEAAAESSDAWNNAGTGHAAFCELNYTPEQADGSIDISKAIRISESFDISRQFWAHMVGNHLINLPLDFINSVPHMSFVWGDKNVDFLRKRYEAMQQSHLFRGMQYSEDPQQLLRWMPLIMDGRTITEKVAATYMPIGTDVNFGALTRGMIRYLQQQPGVTLHFCHEVRKLRQKSDSSWRLKIRNVNTDESIKVRTRFVFIGAGGGALPLLMKSGIPEGEGYGGFPVSGQWLKCTNPEVIEKHYGKVYGKAAVGSPPMSVPHLDSRFINGKRELLFGPYAGFTTRFLKQGSFLDLPMSVKLGNLRPMVAAGLRNIPLTKYLVNQVLQTPEDRMVSLREYMPQAKQEDWVLEHAGKRVQVIKKHPDHVGVLEFGTEVISSADGTLAALLGASPGASTAVSIMLSLLEKCFPEKVRTPEWTNKLREMIPSYGQSLAENEALLHEVRAYTSEVLELESVQQIRK
ncbi:malate:quinone oxidoreductase [Pontibacter sp. SD6]|uniref:Probable malate:quinone oxidoreductase n=2 Tax=Pontibacter cellulosilyticus TaxID=1720253 RepID=A0A923N499_9BACT|nr:malate:quinone oxidoreductase [Pontibacter cellulosilyticus]MBC5992248.1 malate:quinone oxidoreductase [Pontibacter cellulosilyticus]